MNNNLRFILSTTAVCTAMISTASFACLDDKQEQRKIRTFVFSSDGENQTSFKNKTIEIHEINGEMTVAIDGKNIPAHQIKKENGRIRIFDNDGNEIPMFGFTIDGGKAGKGMLFNFGNQNGEWQNSHTMMKWFGGEVKPPKVMIGVQLSKTSKALEYHLGLEAGSSTVLTEVFEGLAAAEAGIKRYDIIVAINGQTPANPEIIRLALADKEPGDEITLRVIHQGKKQKFNVQLEKYDNLHFGTLRLHEIGGNLPFGPNAIIEFKIDGKLDNLHELFVDPHKGNIFRRKPGNREFQFIFNDELLKKLGKDFGEEIELKLRMHLPNEDKLHESRTEMIHEHIERLQKLIDELVEQAGTLEEDDSDV